MRFDVMLPTRREHFSAPIRCALAIVLALAVSVPRDVFGQDTVDAGATADADAAAEPGAAVDAGVAVDPGMEHYRAGLRAAKRGDNEIAVTEFTAAYRGLRDGRILYRIGAAHEKLGNDAVAVTFYRRYLADVVVSAGHRARLEAIISRLDGRARGDGAKSKAAPWWARKAPCAPDTRRGGNAPPLGLRVWCERADGIKHGPYASWHDNGRRRAVGSYHSGKPDGRWSYWLANGQFRTSIRYDRGKHVGAAIPSDHSDASRRRAAESTEKKTTRCPFNGPLPDCPVTLVGELGMAVGGHPGDVALLYDVGFLVNLSAERRDAFGFTFGGFAARDVGRWGFKARYRKYFADDGSIDFSPGVLMFSSNNIGTKVGVYGQLSINLGDYISFGLETRAFNNGTGTDWNASFGVRFGATVVGYTAYVLSHIAAIGAGGLR